MSASPPQWLDNRLVLVDEGDKVWRLDTKRDKCEEMRQIPPPTVRGTHTLALSPDREKLAMEVHVDGGFALGVLSLV